MRKLRIWVRRPKRAPFLDLLGASVQLADKPKTRRLTVWSVTALDDVERDADDGTIARSDVHGPAEVGAGILLHQVSDHRITR